jgi:hypothetical protein
MGYFFLTKKKTKNNADKDAKSEVILSKVGISTCPTSRGLDHSVSEPKPAPVKPPLCINTDIANAFTPPPTPSDGSQSQSGSGTSSPGKKGKYSSAGISPETNKSAIESAITPPQSPTSSNLNGTIFPRRSSLTSLSLFKTPRQRKLQEIRQGKLPAISLETEISCRSTPCTSSDNEPVLTEICDPSSSTTYSPSTRFSKKVP